MGGLSICRPALLALLSWSARFRSLKSVEDKDIIIVYIPSVCGGSHAFPGTRDTYLYSPSKTVRLRERRSITSMFLALCGGPGHIRSKARGGKPVRWLREKSDGLDRLWRSGLAASLCVNRVQRQGSLEDTASTVAWTRT